MRTGYDCDTEPQTVRVICYSPRLKANAIKKLWEEVHLPQIDVDVAQHTTIEEEERDVTIEEILGPEEVMVAPWVKEVQEIITRKGVTKVILNA